MEQRYDLAQRPFHLRLLTAIVLIIVAGTLAAVSIQFTRSRSATNRAKPTYLRGTSYDGIASRVVNEHRGSLYFSVEYPTTGSAQIDTTVSSYIDEIKTNFSNAFLEPTMVGAKGEFNATYLVKSATRDYISMAAKISMSYPMTPLITETHYWTFNRHSGEVISLSMIFGDKSPDGVARTMLYIKQNLREQIIARNERVDDAYLDSLVTSENITNFLVRDNHTLEFDFDKDEFFSAHPHPFTVTISIDRLQLFLQNEIAKKLFDITAVSGAQITTHEAPGTCTSHRCIALTFDDGPGPFTADLLDIFKAKNVHASFFVIGSNVQRYPSLIKRQLEEGHTIGNHTFTHPTLTQISGEAIVREITTTNASIQQITGRKARFFRPPNGAINTHVAKIVGDQAMTSILWSVDTRDWADRKSDIIYNRIVAGARPGSIIILHDIHRTSVDAVAKSIDKFRSQGYDFVTLDEMFSDAQPGKIYSNI